MKVIKEALKRAKPIFNRTSLNSPEAKTNDTTIKAIEMIVPKNVTYILATLFFINK